MCYLLFPVPKAGFARRTGKILEERIQSSCGDVEDASTQMRRGEALLKCLPQKDYVVAVGDNDKSWLVCFWFCAQIVRAGHTSTVVVAIAM